MDILIKGVVVGDKFERMVASALNARQTSRDRLPNDIHFDLSGLTFLDCYSAQLLICYVSLFDRKGAAVKITLPEAKNVRDILRVWNFDDALKSATRHRMFRYCSEDQQGKYFYPHDKQSTFDLDHFPTQYDTEPNEVAGPHNRRSDNSFAFRTINVPIEVEKKPEVANQEKKYWQRHNIRSRLEKDLRISVRYFSARIVFEAVFNALRHPDAELVQTATHTRYIYEQSQLPLPFERTQKSRRNPSKSAVIHYWDNGKSILDLIDQNLMKNENFRTAKAGQYAKTYRLLWKGSADDQPSIDKIVGCDISPTTNSHVGEKLIFILQPFVSMSPTLFGHSSTDETTSDDPRLASVGMGLYLLLDTAVSLFGGKVSIRTANLQMRITKGRSKLNKNEQHLRIHDYLIDIQELPSALPSFPGNLISISLPEQKPNKRTSDKNS